MDADGDTAMWEIQTNDYHSNTKIKKRRVRIIVTMRGIKICTLKPKYLGRDYK